MGVAKKITFISLLVAAVAGTFAKILDQRQSVKKTFKTRIVSFVFRLAGGIFNFLGNKMKFHKKQSWKRVFKMG